MKTNDVLFNFIKIKA